MIVVEGLDGAGKSTQVGLLKQHLIEKYGEIEYIHFPRYNSPVYGELISRFLSGEFGDNDSVHPRLVALLYAEDRHNAAAEIRKSLSEGKVVLLDRYVYSNIAYQCAKMPTDEAKAELASWIFDLEYGKFDIPRPDTNLFLDVPISFVKKQLEMHREGLDKDYLSSGARDIHEENISFQEAVRAEYLKRCEQDPSFVRIDCSDENGDMASTEVIFSRIKAAL